MHRFEMFAFEKYRDLETRVRGHSNYGSILHRFCHIWFEKYCGNLDGSPRFRKQTELSETPE